MPRNAVLAFDVACIGGTVALAVEGAVTSRVLAPSQQAALLMPTIDALLREAGVEYAALTRILTTLGPGSFTGVRIGLATLHGLVMACPVPIALVTTLEALAWQAIRADAVPPQGRFVTSLRAGKGEVYAQTFQREGSHPTALDDAHLAPETQAWNLPVFGYDPHRETAPMPDAAVLVHIAEHLPIRLLAEAVPHYIRPPDAAIPKPLAWLA